MTQQQRITHHMTRAAAYLRRSQRSTDKTDKLRKWGWACLEIEKAKKAAILSGAAAIVVAHNHPSGDTSPSTADLRITRQLVDAGKLLDINLLDHIIIGEERQDQEGFLSLRDNGLASFPV